ncbi:MAG: hypothetical protein WA614_01630, partial [Acidimicrobiales bacterium]
ASRRHETVGASPGYNGDLSLGGVACAPPWSSEIARISLILIDERGALPLPRGPTEKERCASESFIVAEL